MGEVVSNCALKSDGRDKNPAPTLRIVYSLQLSALLRAPSFKIPEVYFR